MKKYVEQTVESISNNFKTTIETLKIEKLQGNNKKQERNAKINIGTDGHKTIQNKRSSEI